LFGFVKGLMKDPGDAKPAEAAAAAPANGFPRPLLRPPRLSLRSEPTSFFDMDRCVSGEWAWSHIFGIKFLLSNILILNLGLVAEK
jgi:hypothetical protein